MSRIADTFTELKREGKKGFIPFVTAGDPNLETTLALLLALAGVGSAVIELGIPFSDPMADGPIIQRASERALKHSFGIEEVLAVVAQARRKIETPIVLFSYFNPLLQFGLERLAREARNSGVDGILVTDLTPEEAEDFKSRLRANKLDMILLVAPTSTDARLKMVAARASGFIYAVSRAGVTGPKENVSAEAKRLVERMRHFSDLPVAVGFGISNCVQVWETWQYADAAIVGSAIVAEIEKSHTRPDLTAHIVKFIESLIPEDELVVRSKTYE